VDWWRERVLVNITDEDVDELRDESLEIRYEKVSEWCLPRYGDDGKNGLLLMRVELQDGIIVP
jgi:hypothetical protein